MVLAIGHRPKIGVNGCADFARGPRWKRRGKIGPGKRSIGLKSLSVGKVQAEGLSAFPAAGAFGGIIESQAAMRYKCTPEAAVPWRGAIN